MLKTVSISSGGGGSSNITINTTAITGGTSGRVLYNNAGTVGEKTVTGTGSAVLSDGATMTGSVIVGSGGATANVQLGSGSAVNTILINRLGGAGSVVTIGSGNNGTCNIQNGAGTNQKVNIASYQDLGSPPTSGRTILIGDGNAANKDISIGTGSLSTATSCNVTLGSNIPGASTTVINGDIIAFAGTFFFPVALASAPSVSEGAMYYDTTLHKLRICDNVGWKSITAI